MRYNFHEQVKKVKENPKYQLPYDINKPVIDYLKSINCTVAIEELKKWQERVRYGAIELVSDLAVNAKLSIQVDCGMASGYKEYRLTRDDKNKWTMICYHTVRNSNLDKSKKKEAKSE
jgi:hypothetical protein